MRGALGEAAARLVVVASSRDSESVKGLSLEENVAPVKWESRGAAMRSDALVSDSQTMNKRSLSTIRIQPQSKGKQTLITSHHI